MSVNYKTVPGTRGRDVVYFLQNHQPSWEAYVENKNVPVALLVCQCTLCQMEFPILNVPRVQITSLQLCRPRHIIATCV